LTEIRDKIWDIPKSPPRPHAAPDAFDGDDLQAEDFLVAGVSSSKPKQPGESSKTQMDDNDWFLIDDSSSSQGAPEKPQNYRRDWTADMEQQDGDDDDVPEPVRLANGNWACSHKCRDKTRYGTSIDIV
jgi:ATP-dependent DNA helicase HFM1/MER3